MNNPPARPRFPCFDGYRAVAALLVILVHTAFASGYTARTGIGNYTARGEIGVAVFFLISGFLLYRPFAVAHLSGERAPSTREFFRRRALRILPAYWVALTIIAFVFHAVPKVHGVQGIVVYYGLLQIYFSKYIIGGIAAAWSLCTELSFYLFLPLYAALVRRRAHGSPERRLRAELVGVTALYAVSVAFRGVLFAFEPPGAPQMGSWLPSYGDLFALGIGLAIASAWCAQRGREPRLLGTWLAPTCCWALAALSYWAVSTQLGLSRKPLYTATAWQAFSRQFLYGSFALFLLLPGIFGPQHRGLIRAFLRNPLLQWVGVISYGIYIWHELWITKILDWVGNGQPFTVDFGTLLPLTVGGTIVVAALSYVIVERPFLRLKSARRAPPPVVAPEPALAMAAAVGE